MKSLSIWQPWASLVAVGAKRIETRHWPTHYRGPIAIHAAKRFTDEERYDAARFFEQGHLPCPPGDLPLGAIVAVATLALCVRMTDFSMRNVGETERSFGYYEEDRYMWMLEDVRPIRSPIPCRGAQGLWNVPPDVLARIEEVAP